MLIPAALENQITMENAPEIRAKIVVEGANGPTTPDAHKHLHERGVLVVPDILANSGGVTTSYFEWVQDRYGYFWTEKEVNERLEAKMCEAFNAVLQTLAQVQRRHAAPPPTSSRSTASRRSTARAGCTRDEYSADPDHGHRAVDTRGFAIVSAIGGFCPSFVALDSAVEAA